MDNHRQFIKPELRIYYITYHAISKGRRFSSMIAEALLNNVSLDFNHDGSFSNTAQLAITFAMVLSHWPSTMLLLSQPGARDASPTRE